MNKEQVCELAMYVANNCVQVGIENSITEWLEQNKPQPIVVGLTDSQVVGLHKAICLSPPQKMPKAIIKEWLKTQTFAPNYDEKYMELYDDYE